MAVTTPIPVTTLVAGPTTFNPPPTTQPWTNAVATINRIGTPNTDPWLNNLTAADSLTLDIQYSTDGGNSWVDLSPDTWFGGVYTTKGVTATQFSVGVTKVGGGQFPTGTQFKVNLTASTAITVSGTVVYQ